MSTYDINLFAKKKRSFTEKLLFFLLHYFRYIIVITQIVVIGVFFYRFRVDQNIIDHKEAFRSKQQILALTVPLIEEARATEESTAKIEAILEKQESFLKLYDSVIQTVPEGIIIIEVDFSRIIITVSGYADDTFAIQKYYRKLRANELYSDVSIKELNINQDFNFSFTIDITVAQPITP